MISFTATRHGRVTMYSIDEDVADLGRQRVEPVPAARRDSDAGAGARERARRRFADTTARAGDQRDGSVESFSHSPHGDDQQASTMSNAASAAFSTSWPSSTRCSNMNTLICALPFAWFV